MMITDKIKELKEKCPYKTALVDIKTKNKITFSQMDIRSDKICTYFEKKGLKKGDKIVIFIPIGVEFYLILTAILKMGMQAVFIDPYADTEYINKCCETVSPEGIVGSGKTILKGFFLKGIRKIRKKINYVKMLEQAEGLPPMKKKKIKKYERIEEQINEKTPALISFTNENTDFPKVITKTQGFLLGQYNVLEKNVKFEKETSVYSSFPVFALFHMAMGNTTFISDIDLRKPVEANLEDIIRQIKANKIQNIMLSPVIFEQIADYSEGKKVQLKDVKNIYIYEAPVFPKLMEKIRKIFTEAEIRVLYGMSEAGPISILNFEDIAEEDIENMKKGAGLLVGKTVDEIELKIEENEIFVRGENVINEYTDIQENSKDKWYRTEDMGYIDGKGRLMLLGKVKRQIKIGENVYYPLAIETAFSFCKALKKSVLTLKNDNLCLIVERNPEFKDNLTESKEIMELKEKFGIFEITEAEISIDKNL